MTIANNYTWEAEKPDGTIVTDGGSLDGCVRFSLIPAIPGLPRHDLIGITMERRFNRGFVRGMGGGTREYIYCVVFKDHRVYVRASDGGMIITPHDYELYL